MISEARKLVISLELNELGKKLARLFLENPTVVIFIVYVVKSKKKGNQTLASTFVWHTHAQFVDLFRTKTEKER
jgi:hypothetical protein